MTNDPFHPLNFYRAKLEREAEERRDTAPPTGPPPPMRWIARIGLI